MSKIKRQATYAIWQTWPNCGPLNIFVTSKLSIFLSINIRNDHRRKNRPKKFTGPQKFHLCGPQKNIIFKFGPRAKKSGHPCYMVYGICLFIDKVMPNESAMFMLLKSFVPLVIYCSKYFKEVTL